MAVFKEPFSHSKKRQRLREQSFKARLLHMRAIARHHFCPTNIELEFKNL
jgi:ribosomal protein L32